MTHTVVIWNIETYGSWSFTPSYYPGRNRFIKHTLNYLNADALIIQEFKQTGISKLADLCADLSSGGGPAWHYDYLPGAFKSDPDANDPDDFTLDDLCYGSNSEGYAVLWKTGRLQHVTPTMSKGRNNGAGGNYLSLNIEGVKPKVKPGAEVVFQPSAGGNLIVAGYPTSGSPAVVNPAKRQRRSSRLSVDYRAKFEQTRKANMLKTQSRRPCYVTFNTFNNNDVEVVVYHNPVENPASLHGAQLCGLVDRVARSGATGTYRRVIVGGDFNLVGNTDRTNGFANFHHYDLDLFGVDPPAYEGSTVHYYTGNFNPAPVASPNLVDSYLGSARDQWFSKGLTHPAPHTTGVLNLIALLSGPGGAAQARYVETILRDTRIRDMVRDSSPSGIMFSVMVPGTWKTYYDNLKGCFGAAATAFDAPMSVAMLYRGYISDHLPLTVTFAP